MNSHLTSLSMRQNFAALKAHLAELPDATRQPDFLCPDCGCTMSARVGRCTGRYLLRHPNGDCDNAQGIFWLRASARDEAVKEWETLRNGALNGEGAEQ